ncbi:MAG: iron-containing alcohol dehydrogenase [Acidobacteria bacterium]|nr:iron-containing alcohol dehydrogenase [Acidobacteriota bacterium]
MRIRVDVRDAPYEVYLGDGVRHEVGGFIAEHFARARMAVIITSPEIRRQPWFDFGIGIGFGVETTVIEVPDGEAAKTLASLEQVCEQLARHQVSRHDVVVGVGGGAITDLAGFAAAVYLRGVAVLQVPTSIVGQVDAAIGGKTAVNLAAGKNLVGAFHQPAGVWCDTATLVTLSERERVAGMGEVAKCWLLEGRTRAQLTDASMVELIELSVALKARIVAADEFETSGTRALLNYGHTLGHALELAALARNSDELRHGEAVAIGLAFAARLARALGRVGDDVVTQTDAVLDFFTLPRRCPRDLDLDEVIAVMARDKKAHHDLTFVLAGGEGYEVVAGIDARVVRGALEQFREA